MTSSPCTVRSGSYASAAAAVRAGGVGRGGAGRGVMPGRGAPPAQGAGRGRRPPAALAEAVPQKVRKQNGTLAHHSRLFNRLQCVAMQAMYLCLVD